MTYNGKTSFKLFEAGKNREGWFTNEDLIAQFQDFAEGFKHFHPSQDLYFAFDNSMTHRAKSQDGLDVTKLNLSDGGKNVPLLRAGWYMKDGQRFVQNMQTEAGVQKGLRTILIERGKWNHQFGLMKICRPCKFKTPLEDRAVRDNIRCCATTILSLEPDFFEQRDALTEAVEGHGFNILFYPKYHCELNFIENVWGWLKQFYRKNCQYNYKDLKNTLPDTLTTKLDITMVRKFQRRCFRFMSGYRLKNLVGSDLDFAVKIYASHRKIPLDICFEDEKRKYLLKKGKKKLIN